MISRIFKGLYLTIDIILASLLGVILILTVAQVFLRYIVGFSFLWYSELARLLHMWMITLGSVTATHIKVEFFMDRLSPKMRQVFRIFHMVISIFLLVILIDGAIDFAQLTWGDKFVSFNLSRSYIFISLIVAGVLWIPVIIYEFVEKLKTQRNEDTP